MGPSFSSHRTQAVSSREPPFPSTVDGRQSERKKATDLALQEGLDERYRRHKEVAAFAGKQFGEIQLELFPDERYASDTVTALKADPKWDSKLRSELFSRFDIMIAGGLGKLEGKSLRVPIWGPRPRSRPS